ncbi:hypothetical protein CCACVL1_01968 [Corchorus capsularis]|uniref:Uncharacterized protein n=1 Tax=Corchorus capsularis TaxID=210143 RepID=A0A1R3KE10_COCAP|nr:hypothetical protein CCACVL1_01968 [Corchorus capsularis]
MDDLHSLLLGYEYRLEHHTLSEAIPITANIATKTNSFNPSPSCNPERSRGNHSFRGRGRGRGRPTPQFNFNLAGSYL